MPDKKRKDISAQNGHPQKKSKKSAAVTGDEPLKSSLKAGVEGLVPTKTRKRAVDFLSDGEDEPALATSNGTSSDKKKVKFADIIGEQPTKKSKKKNKDAGSASESNSKANGVNGAVDEKVTPTSRQPKNKPVAATSLQAEAQRTIDKEIEDEFGLSSDDGAAEENIDQAANLLVGLDSDTEDTAQDQGLDVARLGAVPNYKKTQKKLLKARKGGSEGTGVVYVGRIPHGFYEQQMRDYFSQFGEITKLRLSRNKRTAASKHFAFIEFEANEVAKIVAETMDNYLMFGHILKCKYVPEESLHPEVWKGANKKYRRIPYEKLERESLAAPKSQSYWQRKVEKEREKREKLATKLKELDYEMPQSKLTDPAIIVNQRKLQIGTDIEPKQLENVAPVSNPTNETSDLVEPGNAEPDQPAKKKKGKKIRAIEAPSNHEKFVPEAGNTKDERLSVPGEQITESTDEAQPPSISISEIKKDEKGVKRQSKKSKASNKAEEAKVETKIAADSAGVEASKASERPSKSKGKKSEKK